MQDASARFLVLREKAVIENLRPKSNQDESLKRLDALKKEYGREIQKDASFLGESKSKSRRRQATLKLYGEGASETGNAGATEQLPETREER